MFMNANPGIPRIYIAIPTRDPNFSPVCGKLFMLLLDLVKNPAFSLTIDIVAGDPVDRGRNLICQNFLKSDADYLLMLDDDVVPTPNVLEMARQDKDVIGGLYYANLPGPGYYSIAYTTDTPPETGAARARLGIGRDIENTGIIEVALLATGCMMIHRRVLEGLEEPFFVMEMDETIRWITDSEDFSFCRKARKAGFRVWLDTGVTCGHIKTLDMRESILWAQEYSRRQGIVKFLRDPPEK
jgi:GT2 family glycosyltransferase